MKKLFIVALLFTSSFVRAQDEKGIKFQHGLTWAQVKEKAKNEKKYIFMDGLTTWCLPCRVMSNEIFPLPNVADFFNTNFINVAVQFDVTKNDTEEVRSWYKDAKSLKEAYNINSYPTYLFFNPEGELVHRVMGASATAEDFISKAKGALDPQVQYFTLKRQYEAGKKNPDFLLLLTNAAQLAKDSKFLPVVIHEYLATQKDLLTKENLKLLTISTLKSNDPGFTVFRNNAITADLILGKGKSDEIIRSIVFDEIVLPYLRIGGIKTNYGGGMIVYSGKVNDHADWNEIKAKLDVRYPDLSEEIIMSSKPMYYQWLKNWPEFSESVSEYLIKYGDRLSKDLLNTYAWTILADCEDMKCVESALKWSKKTLTGEGAKKVMYLYTYGNLIYKSGKKEEAIKFLEEAVKVSGEVNGDLTMLLNKMKKGEKTW